MFFLSISQLLELYSPCTLILLISFPLSQFPLFFKPLSLWPRISFFLELSELWRRIVLGDLYSSISLGVASRVSFPRLVRLSSSSLVYLYLFWSSWVPNGRCLSLLSHFLGRNFSFLSFIRLPLHLLNHAYFLRARSSFRSTHKG